MVILANQQITIHSYMQLTPSCASTPPVIYWTINQIVDKRSLVAFTGFAQPNTSVLILPPETLDAGDYLIYLEIAFPGAGPEHWKDDYMFLRIVYPELVTKIAGGDWITVKHGAVVFVDATASRDPLSTLLADQLLIGSFSFQWWSALPSMDTFLSQYPVSLSVPGGGIKQEIFNGSQYYLLLDTNLFPANSHGLVMFTLVKGSRKSSIVQLIKFASGGLPLSIRCVYNCPVARDRKYNFDKLELDSILPDSVTDISGFTFRWRIQVRRNVFGIWLIQSYFTSQHRTGFRTRSLGLNKGALAMGDSYKISLTVSAPGYTTSIASLYVYVNYRPRDGNCTLNAGTGVAAKDWMTLSCGGWKGPDDRRTNNDALDVNPVLFFDIVQITAGAFVREEPILQTRAMKTFLIMKVGDPLNSYQTQIRVQVTDMYLASYQIVINVASTPAFPWYDVMPSEAGATLVRSYSTVDFVEDANQLTAMGKYDMIISLIASVCSHFHLIVLPVPTPPVPYLPDANTILDLSSNGTKPLGTIDEALVSTSNLTIDPATIAIQEVLESMTALLRDAVERNIVNGNRGSDKLFTSMITNAFTNIAYKDNFINLPTKSDLIFLALTVGEAALEPDPNSIQDQSSIIDRMAGEIYNMFQAVVNSVVPNKLKEARPVSDYKQAQSELEDLITVIGQNFDLDATEISPDERAYLYMQMQAQLSYDIDTTGYKDQAKDAALMSLELAKKIQNTLRLCQMCSNAGATNTEQLVKKNSAETIKTGLTVMPTASFRVDGLLQGDSSGSPTTSTSVSAFEYTENVFMYDSDLTSSLVTSNVLRLDVKTDSYTFPRSTTFDQVVPTPEPQVIIPLIDPEDASMFSYHMFVYKSNKDNICMIVKPLNDTILEYEIYIRFEQSPSLLEYDVMVTVTAFLHWQVCLLPQEMMGHQGITYLAVRMTEETRNIRYNFTLITVSCMVWDEAASKWYTDKCDMEWLPFSDRISCYCNDVNDLTFGNSFFVAPNSIDFASVFLKFSPLNQAAVMGCLSGLFIIYIIAVIFLAGLDRRDILKWGVTPLRDNIYGDDNFYIIKVFTGMRRGAGTRSRIAFILTGQAASTGPREMFDGLREEFPTGSILSFFMATRQHLGSLEYLSIWHDNEGEDNFASWYLNQVVFYDIQTRQTYTFIAERWLSVEDGIEARLTSSTPDVPMTFESRFFFQTRDRLSESHMWVSIAYRPQISQFSRVQRASCALLYILLTMIANAMYYNPEPDYEHPPLIAAGPLRFTLPQIYISMICALITTPAVMVVVFIFKRSKCRPLDNSKEKEDKSCCSCCYKCPCSSFCQSLFYSRIEEERKLYEQDVRNHLLSSETPDFSGSFYLPHWFVYFGWFLVIGGCVTSAFFILLYSMEWGKQKSEEWLSTVLMSMLESMLFVDPIVVICLSFVFACIFRSIKQDTSMDINIIINNYKKLRWQDKDGCDFSYRVLHSIKDEYEWFKKVPLHITPPLRGSDLEREVKQFQHKDKLSTLLRDILINLFLIFLVLSIAYSDRDDRSFHLTQHVENTFINPPELAGFYSIISKADLFTWIQGVALPTLFPEFDERGEPLHWSQKVYSKGENLYRLGPPRLRQLRVPEDICSVPWFGHVPCYDDYSILGEDSKGYCIAWEPGPCSKFSYLFNVSINAWNFTSALDIWGLPLPAVYKTYGGGGYIATFDINYSGSIRIMDELFSNRWLDRKTRAAFLEFTLYSPSTNIFIYNVFMVEFPETGGTILSQSIYPLRIYTHSGPKGTYALICEIIFLVYLFILLIKICIQIYKQRCKYFHKFWQVYDIVLFCIAVVAIAMFFMRLGFASKTIKEYKLDPRNFVNFAHIVFWDQLLTTFLGFLLFFITLRILEVFSTSKRVQALIRIFSNCGGDLASFGMTFIYIFIGFAIFGYFLFGMHLDLYIDVYNSMTTLFLATLGVTKFLDIEAVQPVLSKIFYCLYILTVVFFTLTIFMSILGSSIDTVMHDTINNDEEDLVDYLMRRVVHLMAKPSGGKPLLGGRYIVNRMAPAPRNPKPQPAEEETKVSTINGSFISDDDSVANLERLVNESVNKTEHNYETSPSNADPESGDSESGRSGLNNEYSVVDEELLMLGNVSDNDCSFDSLGKCEDPETINNTSESQANTAHSKKSHAVSRPKYMGLKKSLTASRIPISQRIAPETFMFGTKKEVGKPKKAFRTQPK